MVKINSQQASVSREPKADERIREMRSYNHLWEKFISEENIESAKRNALKGKRNRKSVRRYIDDPDFNNKIRDYAENYHNAPHTPIQINDGIIKKVRTIIVPTFPELVIQHMAVNVLAPIFMKGMYEHSYGSIPGRGAHRGKQVIQKWISKGKCRNCVKMDIRKYFRFHTAFHTT